MELTFSQNIVASSIYKIKHSEPVESLQLFANLVIVLRNPRPSVFFPQTTVLPGQTEVELSLSLSTSTNHGTALFEPANSFVEKYGVLLAHALTITGTGKTRVRMLNPSSAPVTIYQNERVGELYPTTTYIPESLCTLQQTKPGQLQRDPAMVRKVVEQLLPDSPDVGQADTDRLRALLHEFSDIISVDASDLGQTTLVQHEINTGDATPIRQPPRRLPCVGTFKNWFPICWSEE